jgi:hypothetical protein
LKFTIGGRQDYGEAYDFAATIGAARLAQSSLEVGGYKKHAFTATVDLPAGKQVLTLATDSVKPNSHGKLDYLELRPRATIVGPQGPEFAEYPEARRRIFTEGTAPRDPGERRLCTTNPRTVGVACVPPPRRFRELDRIVIPAERSPRFRQLNHKKYDSREASAYSSSNSTRADSFGCGCVSLRNRRNVTPSPSPL